MFFSNDQLSPASHVSLQKIRFAELFLSTFQGLQPTLRLTGRLSLRVSLSIIKDDMAQRDYYDVLGIKRSATDKQIKSSYRRLARKFHPDVNKSSGAADKFKEATAAYEVLSDPEKRKMYDRFGHAGPGQFGAGSGRGAPGAAKVHTWTSGGAGGFDFDDLFSSSPFSGMSLDDLLAALGGRSRRSARKASSHAAGRAGRDAEANITLEFMQAVKGCTTTMELRRGDGVTEKIDVRIPSGVREGSKVRLRGKGGAGRGGNGDLYIITHVRDHPYFRRDGADIYVDLPISVTEAALGGKVTVPTIDGPTVLQVPPQTSGRTRLRLRSKGVADPKTGKRGDQYAIIKIVLPKTISEKGRKLLDEFNRSDPYDPRERVPW